MPAVAIADEETIRNLDAYKARLARPPIRADFRPKRGAQQVIAQAKPIYAFTGGLHSAETGPPEMLHGTGLPAGRGGIPVFDNIRKNVIVFPPQPPSPTAAIVM